ncbi:MAG: sugar kinase [Clostridiales bacterium]|jgi:2-dehydro-3-deoxygluconokinase|nr:sugar kinase [Clostridiales bacterium]
MKVLCVGEIMLRLQPKGYKKIVQAKEFDIFYGGAEANVSVSLSNFGLDAWFLSKVPNNPLGDSAVNSLKELGVNTSLVVRGGERLGIYYSEKGAAQRPSTVTYDRKYAAFSEMDFSEIDLDKALSNTTWLHFTGITPALSEKTEELTLKLLKAAKQKGITVSCDLNYRKKLWSQEKAKVVMTRLMQYVDLLISNEEDCKDVFGITADNSCIEDGKLSVSGYKKIAEEVSKEFGIKKIAFSLRESYSASTNGWAGIYYDNGVCYESKQYKVELVDRIGGGDSFGAGLIYGNLMNKSPQETLDFAVAASAIKQTIEGDYNLASVKDVESLMKGSGSGRVQR